MQSPGKKAEMNLDMLIDTLLDGLEEAIADLPNLVPVNSWYEYSDKYRSMRVRCGNEIAHMYKLYSLPACVSVFGSSHAF